jgi:hypothetical protein
MLKNLIPFIIAALASTSSADTAVVVLPSGKTVQVEIIRRETQQEKNERYAREGEEIQRKLDEREAKYQESLRAMRIEAEAALKAQREEQAKKVKAVK